MEKPKHSKASFSSHQKFFQDISNFDQLESRISSLPTNKEKGDAFEIFAEAYLVTQPLIQAEIVWPFNSIPLQIKERFGLHTGNDMGVDGIFKTNLNEFNAYQAKFRSGRPSLNWGELSTFMGLTDQVNQRVLFTNCDELPPVINNRTGFYCIRGSDLDKLEKRDFENIIGWLENKHIPRAKKEPFEHQIKAIKDILSAFDKHNRATNLMACGTGKTLVALWVAERMKCKKVLVLVPSLALLRQTLHEWFNETHWDEAVYLCVCSDPTVAKKLDEVIIRQSDLDFPVTTESETVREFLNKQFNGVKIVFSTYQSAQVVAEGMSMAIPFELGIFDEAHKTAGREGAKFTLALKDENIAIKKRLFMTATPRHYNLRKRDEEGDHKIVYSMDIPELYGPVAHSLSFAEAARSDIICNYKVIISVVTSEMVNAELLRRGEVIVNGDPVEAH
jgi:predicted helicase